MIVLEASWAIHRDCLEVNVLPNIRDRTPLSFASLPEAPANAFLISSIIPEQDLLAFRIIRKANVLHDAFSLSRNRQHRHGFSIAPPGPIRLD